MGHHNTIHHKCTQPDDQSMQPSGSVLHLQVAMLWWPCLRTCLRCLYLQKMARCKRVAGTTIAAATVKVMPKKTNCEPERILRAQGGMDENYAVA